MKKFLTLLLFTSAFAMPVIAQTDWEVPEGINYKTEKDYENYEDDIVKAADWLEETDLSTEKEKRAKANLFVLQWVAGSPSVTISLGSDLINLFKKNPDFMALYFASYSKHCLLADSVVEKEAIKSGLKSIINVYNKDKGIVKDKKVKKIAAMTDEQLMAYIDEKLVVKKK